MQALGRHLLVELHGCPADPLKKVDFVRDAMLGAALACRATIVDSSFHEFSPFGVSGVVILAESHLSVHTWPEYHYAAVDIFICGKIIKPEEAVDYIGTRFRCRNPSIVEMKRGVIPGRLGITDGPSPPQSSRTSPDDPSLGRLAKVSPKTPSRAVRAREKQPVGSR